MEKLIERIVIKRKQSRAIIERIGFGSWKIGHTWL